MIKYGNCGKYHYPIPSLQKQLLNFREPTYSQVTDIYYIVIHYILYYTKLLEYKLCLI